MPWTSQIGKSLSPIFLSNHPNYFSLYSKFSRLIFPENSNFLAEALYLGPEFLGARFCQFLNADKSRKQQEREIEDLCETMCRQNCVHLSVEEAVSVEETLLVYCKPVELYNILRCRALENVIFVQFL